MRSPRAGGRLGRAAATLAAISLATSGLVGGPTVDAVVVPTPADDISFSTLRAVDHTGRFVLVSGSNVVPAVHTRIDRLTGVGVDMPPTQLASGDLRYVLTNPLTGGAPLWWSVDAGSGVPIPAPPGPWGPVVATQMSRDGQLLVGNVEGPSPTVPFASQGAAVAVTRAGGVSIAPIVPSSARAISPGGRFALFTAPCPASVTQCAHTYRWDLATGAVALLSGSDSVRPFAIGDDGAVVQVEFAGDPTSPTGTRFVRRAADGGRLVLVDVGEGLQRSAVSQDATTFAFIDTSLQVVVVDGLTGARSFGPRLMSGAGTLMVTGDGAFGIVLDQVAFPTIADIGHVAAPGRRSTPRLQPGETYVLPIAAVRDVPGDATAVAINLTITNPAAAGYATVWPCDRPRPLASNINFVTGQTVANAVIAQLATTGPDTGTICLTTNTAADLVVDVQGWFTGTTYTGTTPDRFLDTRNDETDTTPNVAADTTTRLPIAAVRDVPGDATAVAINLTITNPAAAGYATVWPCDRPRPLASNINFVTGQTVANAVIAQLATTGPDTGTICLTTNTAADLVVDVQGWFTGTTYTGTTPDRFLDTRNDETDTTPNVAADTTTRLPIAAVRDVPGDATAVAINLTITNPASAGYATVWPCDRPRPLASNINFVTGQTVANAVIAQLATTGPDTGTICLTTNTAADLVVDVQGWFTGTTYTGTTPDRFLDTRD